jgi:hypothetical protein
MCMFFYSRIYISNKTNILFLKKLYLVCTTLILMDSNIIKIWPYHTKTTSVFEQNNFILIHPPPQKSKCSNMQIIVIWFQQKKFIPHKYFINISYIL